MLEKPVDCPQELYNPYKQDVFTSTKGNTYSAVKFVVPFAKEYQEPDVPEVRQAIYPMGILVDILRKWEQEHENKCRWYLLHSLTKPS